MLASFKSQLIAVSSLGIVTGTALLTLGILQQEQAGSRQAQQLIRSLATEVAQKTTAFLDLRAQIVVYSAIKAGDDALLRGKCTPNLVFLRDALPGLRNLGFVDVSGRLQCSLVPAPSPDFTLKSAPWFVPALEADGTAVGGAFKGAILGGWVTVLTHPVRDDSGRIVGLATLPVDLRQFEALLPAAGNVFGGEAGIIDASGRVVVLSPARDDVVGQMLPDANLLHRLLGAAPATEGVVLDDTGNDRLVAFADISFAGWRAFVAVPTDQIYADIRKQGRVRIALFASLLILVFASLAGVAGRLLQQIRALAEFTRHASDGLQGARAEVSGPSEVRELAIQFNQLLERQRQYAAALREKEEHYRAIVENSPDAIVVLDLERGLFDEVNRKAEELFCLSREVLLRSDPASLSPPLQPDGRSSAEAAGIWLERADRGETPMFEWTHRASDGREIACEVRLVRMPGLRRRIRGSIIDLTGRKRLERDLELRHAAINAAPSAIAFADPQGLLTFANPAYARMWGYHLDQIIGQPAQRFLASKEEADTAIETLRRDGRWFGEVSGQRSDGSKMLVEITASMIYDADDQPLCMMGVFVDITERKAAEQRILELNEELEHRVAERTKELAAANRELEAFSYSVSHDLRSPLRAIDGYSAIVMEQERGRLTDDSMDLLLHSRKASQRMAQMIEDLLGLAKISRSEPKRRVVDCTAIVKRLAAELAGREPSRQCRWDIADGVRANADPGLISIVLQNLVENAWRYSSKRPDSRIEFGVRLDPAKGRVYYVSDNGAGFEQAYAGKLFGAFQRLHSDQQFPGHGIGLATVRRAVLRHGGMVWARGVVDEGAEFSFSLGGEDKVD